MLAITAFVVATFTAVGVWTLRGGVSGIEEFISARNSAGAGTLTATVIASSMGAWILLSPAEAGAAYGGISAILGYAFGSALPLLAFAVIGPRIRSLIPEGHSLTEYTYARFGPVMYGYVLLVSVGYMFAFLAAEMTGITLALSMIGGVPMWQTSVIIGVFVLVYTTYGGLRASIATDTIQALVILPLLAVTFVFSLRALGGTGAIYETVTAQQPELLDLTFGMGLESGIYLTVAVMGAEMLNQAWWQRLYAARDSETLRRSFAVAAVAVVPMIFVAGLFGLAAQGLGLVENDPSIAFFLVVNEVFSEPVVLAIVVLAVLLVMSSADTLFNAISSVVTVDLPRLAELDDESLTTGARALTVIVALAVIVIGAQGYSVLTIFFVADLLAVATFIPLIAGLYTSRLSGTGAFVGAFVSLLVGTAVFPITRPLLTPIAGSLPPATYFNAFVWTAIVSTVLTLLAIAVGDESAVLSELGDSIDRLDATQGGDGQ